MSANPARKTPRRLRTYAYETDHLGPGVQSSGGATRDGGWWRCGVGVLGRLHASKFSYGLGVALHSLRFGLSGGLRGLLDTRHEAAGHCTAHAAGAAYAAKTHL